MVRFGEFDPETKTGSVDMKCCGRNERDENFHGMGVRGGVKGQGSEDFLHFDLRRKGDNVHRSTTLKILQQIHVESSQRMEVTIE